MCEVSDLILRSELSECSSLRTLRILDRGCCRGMWFVCTPSDSVSWITDGLFRLFLLHRLPFLEFSPSFYRFTSCLSLSPASALIVLHLDASKAYAHTRTHTHASTHTHWQWFGFAGEKRQKNAEGITWKRWVTKLCMCFCDGFIIYWFQYGKRTCCRSGKDCGPLITGGDACWPRVALLKVIIGYCKMLICISKCVANQILFSFHPLQVCKKSNLLKH